MPEQRSEFMVELTLWCVANGVAEKVAIIELLTTIEKYFYSRHTPDKYMQDCNYPDYKEMRKRKGLKAKDVAKATGITSATISHIENRRTRILGQDLKKKLDDFYNEN